MGRLFITGDTHNNIDIYKLSTKHFPEQKDLTKEDVLLIAGDFGVPWYKPHARSDEYLLNQYEERNFTTVFIDGNHENFEALYEYPQTIFAGACCHQLRPHVFHAMRGEVLQLAGHKVLCMGGADSTDKISRKEHVSWWKEEHPTEEEWKIAEKNLRDQQPDLIVTHDAPACIVQSIHPYNHPTEIPQRLEGILYLVETNHISVTDWYFGHHHIDDDLEFEGINYHMRYQKITEVPQKAEKD